MKLFSTVFTATVLTAALASAGTQAGEIYLDVGQDFSGDGDTITDAFTQFGFTQAIATSFYELDPATGLFTGNVIDSNVSATMDGLGFNAASQTAIDGSTVDQIPGPGIQPYDYPTDPTQRNVDTLENIGTGNTATEAMGIDVGMLQTWELVFDYYLVGTFDPLSADPSVSYTEGYFDVYYRDIATQAETQVFRLDVDSSTITGTSLLLDGNITYDWTGDGIDDSSAFAQDFLVDAATGNTYHSLWATGADTSWRLDTNVDPAFPTPNQLVAGDIEGVPSGYLYRQSSLDGSIIVDVPEPSVVALLGLGLFAVGLFSRKKISA